MVDREYDLPRREDVLQQYETIYRLSLVWPAATSEEILQSMGKMPRRLKSAQKELKNSDRLALKKLGQQETVFEREIAKLELELTSSLTPRRSLVRIQYCPPSFSSNPFPGMNSWAIFLFCHFSLQWHLLTCLGIKPSPP